MKPRTIGYFLIASPLAIGVLLAWGFRTPALILCAVALIVWAICLGRCQ